jgi:RNA polymerase sigma factor (TIGR02999 family)
MAQGRSSSSSGDVTRLLGAVAAGDRAALDDLLPLLYAELRGLARRQLRRERREHTLHPTALVHEAYLRLLDHPPESASSRSHFLALAARVMRQVLVDHARRRGAAKRGGDWVRTGLTGDEPVGAPQMDEVLALDSALDELDERSPRLREVVECRFFAGMGEEEIAEALGVSTRTVERDWVKARAWLYQRLYPGAS